MRLARVLTRAQSSRFAHPLTQLKSHIRQLHDALGEANGGVGAALRGCRKHRGAVGKPALLYYFVEPAWSAWYEILPARVWLEHQRPHSMVRAISGILSPALTSPSAGAAVAHFPVPGIGENSVVKVATKRTPPRASSTGQTNRQRPIQRVRTCVASALLAKGENPAKAVLIANVELDENARGGGGDGGTRLGESHWEETSRGLGRLSHVTRSARAIAE